MEKYAGQWVFIENGRVTHSNKDIYDLCNELTKQGIYPAGDKMKYIMKDYKDKR